MARPGADSRPLLSRLRVFFNITSFRSLVITVTNLDKNRMKTGETSSIRP